MDAIIFCYGNEWYAYNVTTKTNGDGYFAESYTMIDLNTPTIAYGSFYEKHLEEIIPIEGT